MPTFALLYTNTLVDHDTPSDLPPQKNSLTYGKRVFSPPPQKIRHAATAMTGKGCSVAAEKIALDRCRNTAPKGATVLSTRHIIRHTPALERHGVRVMLRRCGKYDDGGINQWPKR